MTIEWLDDTLSEVLDGIIIREFRAMEITLLKGRPTAKWPRVMQTNAHNMQGVHTQVTGIHRKAKTFEGKNIKKFILYRHAK